MLTISFLRSLVCALLLLPFLCLALRAAEVTSADLAATVPGKPGVTYLDLARKIIPDLALSDNIYLGHRVIDLRHIGGPDRAGDPPETINLPGIAALAVRSGGRSRLALLLDLGDQSDGDGFAVLALFDLSGEPKLLDAADIAYDRSNYFGHPPVLSIGEGTDVVLAIGVHLNAVQSYIVTPLILVRDDRFELIDAISTFDDAHCNFSHNQTLDFKLLPGAATGFATIRATVTDVTTPSERPCEGEDIVEAATKTFTVSYKWNPLASRYEPDSDDFKKLAAENETRY